MKQTIYIYVIILLLAGSNIFLSCSATQTFTAAESEFVNIQWPGSSVDDLKNGMKIYRMKCGKCHYLYKPEKYSFDKWNQLMPVMAKKSNLSETEEKLILKYVLTKSKKAETSNENIHKNKP